jgi:hypothetical protein
MAFVSQQQTGGFQPVQMADINRIPTMEIVNLNRKGEDL